MQIKGEIKVQMKNLEDKFLKKNGENKIEGTPILKFKNSKKA
jgi:hypothetical protein